MNKKIINAIKPDLDRIFPEEGCGLLVVNKVSGSFEWVLAENVAEDKRGEFAISDDLFWKYKDKGEIVVVHSHCDFEYHPNLIKFSKQDKIVSEETGLPFLLYANPNNEWNYYEPNSYTRMPLLRRPFVRGLWDCYALVKDYYKLELGHHLDPYLPPADDAYYNFPDFDESYEREGFREIPLSQLDKNDLILFKVGNTNYSNHIGVYLGDNKLLHHSVLKRYSRVDELNQEYLKCINKVIRLS